MNNLLHYLAGVKREFEALNLSTQGVRIEPCTILMRGPPGVGKSNLMAHFAMALLEKIVPEEKRTQLKEDPQSFIFNLQSENVYWEGYNSDKYLTYIDDIGQVKDVAGNADCEWMKLIRMCSLFEYVLHMASIDKKGNTRFCSRVVIINTNRRDFQVESIVEVEAAKRRCDLVYDVVPKVEYCKPGTTESLWSRRLDLSKLPIGVTGTTSLLPEVEEFHEIDFMASVTGMPTGRIMTFEDVLIKTLEIVKMKANRHDQLLLDLNSTRLTYNPQGFVDLFYKKKESYPYYEALSQSPILHRLAVIEHIADLTGDPFPRPAVINKILARVEEELECTDCHDSASILQLISKVYVVEHDPSLFDSAQEAYNKFKTYLTERYNSLPQIAKDIVTYGAAAVPILTATYMLYSSLSSPSADAQEYSGKSQKENTSKQNRPKPRSTKELKSLRTAAVLPQALLESQANVDQNNLDIVQKVIKRNTYSLVFPGASAPIGSILFVKGRIALMPRHFITRADIRVQEDQSCATAMVRMLKSLSDVQFKVEMRDLFNIVSDVGLESLDLVCVEFPMHVPNHADITKYFISRSELAKVKLPDFRLVIPRKDGTTSWIGKAERVDSIHVRGDHPYVIQKAFRYRAPTGDGDCGGLFTLMNPYIPNKKICGIHTAGLQALGLGIASVITSEDITTCLEDVPYIHQDFEDDCLPQASSSLHDTTFCPLYYAAQPVPQVFSSEIKKSELFGEWGPNTTLPARLREFEYEGKIIDPYAQAIQGYNPEAPYVEPELLSIIGKNVLAMLESRSSVPVDRGLLTLEEAIKGDACDPEMKAINKSTSMGYPYNTLPLSKKTQYFGQEPGYDMTTKLAKELISRLEKIESDAKNGIRNLHVFTSTIKDERRKIAKVYSGNSRLFEAGPFDLLVLMRRYFGRFVSWMQKNRIDNGSAVGINPFSAEWNMLAEKLNQFGDMTTKNKGAGDFEKYDKLLYPVVQNVVLEIINTWYNDGHDKVREILFLEITNTRHIRGNLIFEDFFANPSGGFLTTTLNVLTNHIAANYAWLRSHENQLSSLPIFYDSVYYVAFGDDNAFSVREDETTRFNEEIMQKYVSELGMRYTNENKTQVSHALRSLSEISFLKRGFKYIPFYDRVGAPLELGVILEMPYWTKKGITSEEITRTNVDCALRELSLHESSIFTAWAPKLVEASRKCLGYVPPIVNRELLLATIDGREDFY